MILSSFDEGLVNAIPVTISPNIIVIFLHNLNYGANKDILMLSDS